jgi:osmotically-inducible protein OsmY
MKKSTNSFLSLMGGAGAGAVAVYLLDPARGSARRACLRNALSASHAGDAVQSGLRQLQRRASKTGQSAASAVGATYSSAGKALASKSSSFEKRLRQHRHRAQEGLSDIAHEMGDRLRYLVRGSSTSRQASIWSHVLVGVSCLAAGMGIMFLLDPVAGNRRRAMVRDKAVSASKHSGRAVARKTADLWNRAAGSAHEMRWWVSEREIDDRVLADRIRAEIGRCVSNAKEILIRSEGGRVTISGPVAQGEVDGLLGCVYRTRGVKDVINRLDVRSEQPVTGFSGQRF